MLIGCANDIDSVTQEQSGRETVDSQSPKRVKSGVWDPSAFKGFTNTSLHMESVDSQFGIVYHPAKNPNVSGESSVVGSQATSPAQKNAKSDVLSEVVVVN